MSTFADRKTEARRKGFAKWFCNVVAIHPYLGVMVMILMAPILLLATAGIGAVEAVGDGLGSVRSSIRSMLNIARKD